MTPDQIPGFLPAVRAVRRAFPLIPDDAAYGLVAAALGAAIPHLRAELAADLADELLDLHPDAAATLDAVSAKVRQALE